MQDNPIYPNLMAEMARINLKIRDIVPDAECTYTSLKGKFSGKTDFTRGEMVRIRDRKFPKASIDYLFKRL